MGKFLQASKISCSTCTFNFWPPLLLTIVDEIASSGSLLELISPYFKLNKLISHSRHSKSSWRVHSYSFCYRSALHYTARYEKPDILKELLAHNASVLAENSDGM